MSAPGRPAAAPAGPGATSPEAILRERARELAQAREEQTVEAVFLLPLEVGGERYAVEVGSVYQVLDARLVEAMLGAPRGVVGAVMSRTRPVPVFDLRQLLGLQGGGLSDLQRVVVLKDEGDLFGLAVERVAARVEAPRAELRPAESGPFRFMAPGRMPVLDPARLVLGGGEGA
jgi:purine-binding chemotaxis protein CheW